MFAWGRIIPNTLNCMSKLLQSAPQFHSVTGGGSLAVSPGGLFNVTTRNIVRVHFPRPSERKRVKRHGWQKRMSTPSGRRIIMNRILKGRFVYTH